MQDKEIGERIKFLRESNGFTRENFAEKVDISSKFLYEIETGKKGFSAEILLQIARALSVSCDYILTGYTDRDGNMEKVAAILASIEPKHMGKVKDILRLIQEICIDKPGKSNN
ncbi:MAG: helix-turn-helix domain-containing protein [Suilimivivens sp.]